MLGVGCPPFPVDSQPDLTVPDRVTRQLGDTGPDKRTLAGSARLAWSDPVAEWSCGTTDRPNGKDALIASLLSPSYAALIGH